MSLDKQVPQSQQQCTEERYLRGFNNEHESEAVPGALPNGQFSPQQAPLGLYTEKFSLTAFTAPRSDNRRTWFYRLRPSVTHATFTQIEHPFISSEVFLSNVLCPNQTRWSPFESKHESEDFLDGLRPIAVNSDVKMQQGISIYVYTANKSMHGRYFYNSDGELLIVPQKGVLTIHTECGLLKVGVGEIVVIPRGIKFRVEICETSRGYVMENCGSPLRLPERGPVGSDGYANDRDFLYPQAAFENSEGNFELITKFGNNLFKGSISHSPLDVVAWIGRAAPYKYDMARFNTMGSVSYDHPDPSIYTVLTSPSDTEGVANADFVIFPSRWMVAENTFRPPWFHRNIMSEFMGLIYGQYDAKKAGFEPGGASLHNSMSAHGPEADVFVKASEMALEPSYYANTLAFMFETRYPLGITNDAWSCKYRQLDYMDCWQGFDKNFPG